MLLEDAGHESASLIPVALRFPWPRHFIRTPRCSTSACPISRDTKSLAGCGSPGENAFAQSRCQDGVKTVTGARHSRRGSICM